MITLAPKTHKAKNRIREAGTDQVSILREAADLMEKRGRWLLVHFDGTPERMDRWVHAIDDRDFHIIGA